MRYKLFKQEYNMSSLPTIDRVRGIFNFNNKVRAFKVTVTLLLIRL